MYSTDYEYYTIVPPQARHYNRISYDHRFSPLIVSRDSNIYKTSPLFRRFSPFHFMVKTTSVSSDTTTDVSTVTVVSNLAATYLLSLFFFMYLAKQFPQGRWPSHLVFRERQRSHDAQSATLPSSGSSVLSSFILWNAVYCNELAVYC